MIIFRKSERYLGLCLTQGYLSLSEFNKDNGRLDYHGVIKDHFDSAVCVVERIKSAWKGLIHKNDKVFISVPSIKVLKKIIYLSKELNENDIAKYIKLEGRNHFPEIEEELCFDFVVSFSENSRDENMVYLFAVKQEEINSRRKLAKDLKVNLLAIEPENFSVLRFFLSKVDLGKIKDECFIYLVQDFDEIWRLLVFNEREILEDHILFHDDFQERLTRLFKVISQTRKINKIFIPAQDKAFDLELSEIISSSAKIEDVHLMADAGDYDKIRFTGQISLGLAIRGMMK